MFRKCLTATLLLSASAFAPAATAESFQDALAAAYRLNPQLMAERARVREIDENYVQAQAQGRFTANTTASLGYTDSESSFRTGPTVSDTSGDFKPRSFAITGQKPLYQGGRVRSLMGQAKYGILSARENLRNTEQSILLTAATAYADVLQDREIAEIRRNNVRVLTRQESAAKDRFDVGAGTRTDIAQAQSRLALSDIGLATADANLAESIAAFERATGFSPVSLERIPDFALPPTLEATQRMALTYNPQLEAARYSQDAAKFGIDVAKSANKPVVSLQTFAQFNDNQSTTLVSQDAIGLAANLTIPLLTGGANASRVRAATAAQNRSIFEVRNVEDAINERVAGLWSQLEGAKRVLVAGQRQIDAAQIAYEGVEIEQQVGTRTALDVLNAEQEVLNAKLTYAQSARNVDILTFQLLTLSGAFDALSLNLPVETYDPRENFETVSAIGTWAPLLDNLETLPLAGPAVANVRARTGASDPMAVETLPDYKAARAATNGVNSFPVAPNAERLADQPVKRTVFQQMKDDLEMVHVPFTKPKSDQSDAP